MNYTKHVNPRGLAKETPQNKKAVGSDGETKTKKNNAGGQSFKLDCWGRLNQFLILGSEGGTYYVGEKKLTKQNAKSVTECINTDGKRTVDTIIEISLGGRAPKQDATLFAYAMCCAADSLETRQYALSNLHKVCRTGTHLFQFLANVKAFRGWGRAIKRAVANWYLEKPIDKLSYQLIKYKNREGFTHRDALRISHPVANTDLQKNILEYVCRGTENVDLEILPSSIQGSELIKSVTDPKKAITIIDKYNLPREAIPTELLNDNKIWEALLPKMPVMAMIRNLGKMSSLGLLKDLNKNSKIVNTVLTDPVIIKKSRIHPVNILNALMVYKSGHGLRGSLSWTPVQSIVESLNKAFYLAFDNVESTGKNIMLALDVSGSMSFIKINNMFLSPREASAALALVTKRVEPNCMTFAFSDTYMPLHISADDNIQTAVHKVSNLGFSRTDCSLPMLYAMEKGLEVDAFVVYTDNETYCGRIHPFQALKAYRDKTGIPAKLIVNGMVSNGFTIADPSDAGMLDVVGFDSAAPAIMSDFIRE